MTTPLVFNSSVTEQIPQSDRGPLSVGSTRNVVAHNLVADPGIGRCGARTVVRSCVRRSPPAG